VRLRGRQEQVGLAKVFAQRERVVQPALVGHEHRDLDLVRHVDGRKDLGGVGQLGNHVGAHEGGDLQAAQAGAGEPVDQRDLGRGGDDLGLVLEPVARADLADGDGVGHGLRICRREQKRPAPYGTGRSVRQEGG
jgi:hypothetical protein